MWGSADSEDLITIIDGRDKIWQEIDNADGGICSYVIGSLGALDADPDFQEALLGLWPSDESGLAQLLGLRTKLRQISDLG